MSALPEIRALLAEHLDLGADDEPLAVDSYTLIVVAEAIEERFGLRVAARELVPENFGTALRLAAFVEGKRR